MIDIDEIRRLLDQCTPDQKLLIFNEMRETIALHPFEKRMNARAEIILEALDRAGDLTIRGIRGIIGEATFAIVIAALLDGWEVVTPIGDLPYDCALQDNAGIIKVQVKMQRRVKGEAWIRNGEAVVEVQRTRTGTKQGAATRPYRFGEFDLLAVCMEPSHHRWDSFLYIPEKWLLPRHEDPKLIQIMQPVSLEPDVIWTNDFNQAVNRLRSGNQRPQLAALF